MRKSAFCLLLAFMALVCLPVFSFAQAPAATGYTYRGDINEDGKVNIFDLLELLKILASPGGKTERTLQIADVDSDGKVNIFDLLGLLKVLSGSQEPGVIYWGPTITGLSPSSAGIGDTIRISLENVPVDQPQVTTKVLIDNREVSMLQFSPSTIRLVIPQWFSGGDIKAVFGSDTTNMIYCYLLVRQAVTPAAGGTVSFKGDEVKIAIDPNSFTEDVKVSITEKNINSLSLPAEMPVVSTPVEISFANSAGQAIVGDTLSEDSIKISFKVENFSGDVGNLAAVVIGQDSIIWYLDGSFDNTGQKLVASLPVSFIGNNEVSGAVLQSEKPQVIGEILLGLYVGVVNLDNYFCKDEGKLEYDRGPSNGIPIIFIHGWQFFPWEQTCALYSEVKPFVELRDYLWSKENIKGNFRFYEYSYPTFYDPSVNAKTLKNKIDSELGGVNNIVLVCHSMGGLIGRYYMEELEGAVKVQKIITCGTPHHGSLLANPPTVMFLPSPGTASLQPSSQLISTLTASEKNVSSSKYVTYGGVVNYNSDTKSYFAKIKAVLAMVYEKWEESDYVVPISSALLQGAQKTKLIGYNHLMLHSGDKNETNKDNDLLFKGIYDDLRGMLRYTVSGSVLWGGSGLAGVSVRLTGGGKDTTATTGTNGSYTFTGIADGTYTATPSRSGYNFSPASRQVTVNGANVTVSSFTVNANTYTVSGSVLSGSSGLSGVSVRLTGGGKDTTATTGTNGSYTFIGISNGNYTVTPSKSSYTFTPSSQSVTVNGANVTVSSFTATAIVVNPTLAAYELSPATVTVAPGGSFTARYQINNPNSASMQVKLDLRYRTSAGVYDEFEPKDTTLTIQPGTAWYERVCRVPSSLADGALDIAWYLFKTDNTQITATSYISGRVTIQSGTTTGDTTVVQGITFVSIPGGTFQMGTNDTDVSWLSHSRPVHSVALDAFKMGRYEITQAQYQAVMGSNPSYFKSDTKAPVEQVTWYDAVTFCNKLSKLAGLDSCYNLNTWACDFTKNGYRLPTEAEWEYACRAGTTTKFYTGDTESDLAKAGWYNSNSGSTTHAVGGKQANAFGLYDMHGNVWEWCNDWWTDYYAANSENNPQGPSTGSARVLRGGSWGYDADYCRSAYRRDNNPSAGSYNVGFRVVSR